MGKYCLYLSNDCEGSVLEGTGLCEAHSGVLDQHSGGLTLDPNANAWRLFHLLWGRAKDGAYDKQGWHYLQRELEALIGPRPRPQQCVDCKMLYSSFALDTRLPDEQWARICPEGDNVHVVLCERCILMRAKRLGATVARIELDLPETNWWACVDCSTDRLTLSHREGDVCPRSGRRMGPALNNNAPVP